MAKIGDSVRFFFWHDGAMRSCDATVTALLPDDVIEADVDFPPEELATGTLPHQSYSRRRSHYPEPGQEEDRHDAGTWEPKDLS